MMSRSYSLVKKDRASCICFDPLNRNALSKDYICYKDLILMERPSIYDERDKQRLDELNRSKIKSLQGVSNDVGSTKAATVRNINHDS